MSANKRVFVVGGEGGKGVKARVWRRASLEEGERERRVEGGG